MGQVRTRDPKPADPPRWEDYWRGVGNVNWLFARELIELSPDVRAHFAYYLRWSDHPALVDDPNDPGTSMDDPGGWVWRDEDLDWEAAAKTADAWAASSTQRRLLALVLSLVQPDESQESVWEPADEEGPGYERRVAVGTRKVDMRDLGLMGSWRDQVAAILFRYIKGEAPHRLILHVPD